MRIVKTISPVTKGAQLWSDNDEF